MPFPIKKKPLHKKTLRRLQKKYDINYGELDRLTPDSLISYDPLYRPEFPPHNMSSPTNPFTGPNTRRNSQVNSPRINDITGSPVIDLANTRSHARSTRTSPRGGRTRRLRRNGIRGLTRRGRTHYGNRNQIPQSNSDSELSNATTPDIPYIP